MKTRLLTSLISCAALAASIGCSDSGTGVGLALSTRSAPAGGPVAALVAAGGSASPSLMAAGDSTIVALGNDTIIIRSVEMVLRDIELKRIDAPSCADTLVDDSGCEEFETGPVLASLPLAGGTNRVISVAIPPGTYDKFEVTIHKPSLSDDAAFVAANPDFDGVSIRVIGTYSQGGTRSDFVFTSELDKEQETDLNPPLTVSEGDATNVTLRVDLATWFLDTGGGALVNPADANVGGPKEGVVKNNIEQSIEGFHDDDSDGLDDDNEEG